MLKDTTSKQLTKSRFRIFYRKKDPRIILKRGRMGESYRFLKDLRDMTTKYNRLGLFRLRFKHANCKKTFARHVGKISVC